MTVYDDMPAPFLTRLTDGLGGDSESFCAGFELQEWRCNNLAFHLAEWLPDYALLEEELRFTAGNSLIKLNQAAVRVYTSEKYKKRGEAGEIALHAVCRGFFDTIPISPRVFYKSASNDVVKAFDMVHVRFPDDNLEIWFGESKLYKSASKAIADAVTSIKDHINGGFLSNEKLLLGPQIPRSTPRYAEVAALFEKNTSLDKLISSAVFAVGIMANSPAAKAAKQDDELYRKAVLGELKSLSDVLADSELKNKIKLLLVYIPLADKEALVAAFDSRLKGLQ